MLHIFRFILLVLFSSLTVHLYAQTNSWRDIYKVKKKDTIYGIATSYGLTVDELMDANPEFRSPDFKLKKGSMVFIPFASKKRDVSGSDGKGAVSSRQSTVRIGVMLPLHDVDGDGKRMVEYYRGLLIGCDSLRNMGINTEVFAWNVAIDDDVRVSLLDANGKKLDVIYGPLYTKQVKPLADFCLANNIKLVIPFSIFATDVQTNPNVFKVFQPEDLLTARAIDAFIERFKDVNPVFIDCNDTKSDKGGFTSGLRSKLEAKGAKYQITNLNSSPEMFAKAFTKGKRNVVIINTGKSPELNLALRKLNELTAINSGLEISLFGYTDWLQYESTYRELFHKYDAYIPSTYYYYKGLSRVASFEQNYRKWFGVPLQEQYIPRFAITGFDHAMFFIKGIYSHGKGFMGTAGESDYKPLQTSLRFRRMGDNGGMQNNIFELVHYRNDGVIETVNY